MKIGVVSDTHIPYKSKEIPDIVLNEFKTVDHIIHAGDLNELSVIDILSKLANVTAVAGNTDSAATKRILGERQTFELGGFKFGVFHGHGLIGSLPGAILGKFGAYNPDCVIFGHSHKPYCKYHGETLLFNPGSPTDKRMNLYYSFGVLELTDIIKPHIILFDGENVIVSPQYQ